MQLLENRNTVNFFVAYLLSAFGYEFMFFIMTIYVYELTKSALNVGVFAALTLLPRLFATFYGIITDRYDRTKVFALVAVMAGLLVMLLVVNSSLAWIYPLWLLTSVFLTFIINVRTALLTEIMAQDHYLRGNAMVLMSLNLAKVGAPILAGAATTLFNMKALFCLTGGIYLLVALFSAGIRMSGPASGKIGRNVIAELKEGLRYMIDSIDLKFLISVAFLWRLFIGLQISLFVVYVKDYLSGTATDYGVFMTTIGAASILGSLVGPWLVKKVRYSTLVFWGLSMHYACFIILGLLHDFHIALSVAFLGYVVFYATLVGLHSLRDKAIRVDMRGRVCGSVTAILTPPAIVSMLAGGYLANMFGVEKVFIGAGTLALASFHLLNLTRSFFAVKARDYTI